ncbi:Tol biopolymer transport system, TolR protein [Olavius algarvensis associated proteobacterium Delta 3]|nr:Tol biopolymer transport system, TolR protein [Olavius algarvensis associated proteobacterium Delta 3]CAB5153138.1 Tol biopolymer transport system, TolR protein [Olavius algarvensis associated proteobacterium Delta 3]
MNSGSDSSRLMSDINVTPFVDVMLVLLIIFMVTAPMMVQGVGVDLPEATSEPLSSKSDPLVVTIDATGQVFINDFSVDPDNLNEKLAKILERRSDREVFLRADQGIPYGAVVRIMAEIKGAGVEKLGMVTTPILEEVSKTPTR